MFPFRNEKNIYKPQFMSCAVLFIPWINYKTCILFCLFRCSERVTTVRDIEGHGCPLLYLNTVAFCVLW